MGTEDLKDYIKNYSLTMKSYHAKRLGNWERIPWKDWVNKTNEHLVSDEALDLMDKMLVYDREKRIAPCEAMEHPYFKDVVEYKKK